MEFNKFRIIVISAICVIILLVFGLVYTALQTPFWMLSFWFGIGTVALTIIFIRYIEKWRMQLSNFLLSITHDDFSGSYSAAAKDDLGHAFSEILKVFKKLRTEKELNHLYLQTIVEHINTALICLDENDQVVIANNPAKKLFNRAQISNLEVIKQFNKELFDRVSDLKSGQKSLLKLKKNDHYFNISVHAADFSLLNQPYRLLSFQDIKAELEEQELDSWKKLVRVLTHEIMNAAIPISTLASVINQMLMSDNGQPKKLKDLNDEEEEDLLHSLKTIEKRSRGIVDFVRVTKSYTNVAIPKIREASVSELLNHVLDLHKPEIEQKNIKVVIDHKLRNLKLNIDSKLIEQVLINILKNSVESLTEKKEPQIVIFVSESQEKRCVIRIKDNGCGMSPEVLDNLFVPFYTTKKEGSGIGLSLSKQIMKMHNGSIEVSSEEGKGSMIELCF